MTEKIRVGVVGVGYLGRIHAKIYHEMSNVELVMLVDHNEANLKTLSKEYDCKYSQNALDLLNLEVDAVSIVVPTSSHFEVAEPFLEAGVATLVEKPIAATVSEAEAMVELARQNEAPFLIGHLERYNPALRKVVTAISYPSYIEVHRLGQFVPRATDVDVMTDLMIHDLDLLLSLTDEYPEKIEAIGSSVVTEHIDLANVRLTFPGGAVANVTASRVSDKRFRRFRVFSPEGYYGIDLMQQELDIITKGKKNPEDEFTPLHKEKIKFENEQPLQVELAHFIDVASKKSMPMVTGLQGMRALRLAAEIRDIILQS